MTWLLESSNYFVYVEHLAFDDKWKTNDNDMEEEFEDFSEALEYFWKMEKDIKQSPNSSDRDTIVYLFKNKSKVLENEEYKLDKILGITSGKKHKNTNRTFMEFQQLPASPSTQCWQLLPLKNKEEAEKCDGEVWEVPLNWDTLLNIDFSKEFNFATIINNDTWKRNNVSVFWNPGLSEEDIINLDSLLEDRILGEFASVSSFYDSGDHSHPQQVSLKNKL